MVLLGVGDKQIETVSFGAEKRWPSVRTETAGPRTGEPISFIRTNPVMFIQLVSARRDCGALFVSLVNLGKSW
jgi:hypothetical protein